MSLTLSQATIPYWVRSLQAMSGILDKAEAFAEAKRIDASVLLNARLAPDMRPLSFQVQVACDMVKGGVARLSGQTAPSFPDDETTFEQLRTRIAKTVDFVLSVPSAEIDAGETRAIELKTPQRVLSFNGRDYAFNFVGPNHYFHATTFYAILRHNGVELGKSDFLAGSQ